MTRAWAAVACMSLFLVMFYLTRESGDRVRQPFTLRIARGLRRWARALWSLSEGIEVGFHHARRVKQEASLELEPRR